MRLDLTNEADLGKLKKRVSASFYKLTGGGEGADDCFQEVVTRMLEGRHQHATIDQAVIDYLRECRNLKGFRRHSEGKVAPILHSYEQGEFDRTVAADSGRDVGAGIDFDRLIGMSRHWERAVMNLYFREDYGQAEIGNLFGVTESRVCQWLERIQSRISARIQAQESAIQRKREGEMAALLPQEAEGVEWRVGQFESEKMAKIESWAVASFNEACF